MKLRSLCLLMFYSYLQNVMTLECYWNKEDKYKFFASKTPYETVRGNLKESVVKSTGCEPVSIWAIIRHGGRNPGGQFARNIRDTLILKEHIISSYNRKNSSLCAQDIENLRNWEIDASIFDNPYGLTKEGYLEMVGIGKRLKEAVPELLSDIEEGEYIIRPAYGARMESSAHGLIAGLQTTTLSMMEENVEDYDILAPYTTCGKYQRDVKNNSNIYLEASNYKKTAEFLKTKEAIERRIGLNFTVTNTEIIALYDLCRYMWKGIENQPSPWCALFSDEDLEVLEYIDDLRHYYRNGYGTPMNEKFGRIPLSDLLTKFQEAKEGKGKKLVAYITHATMMDMILTAQGLHKDEVPLSGSHRDAQRKWRVTTMSTFGVNLIAILNRCNQNEYNVTVYWNEKPLTSLCADGVCSWRQFEEKLEPFLNTSIDFCEFRSTPY